MNLDHVDLILWSCEIEVICVVFDLHGILHSFSFSYLQLRGVLLCYEQVHYLEEKLIT